MWDFITYRGYISQILDSKISSFVGQFAFALYIVHIFVFDSDRLIIFPMFPDYLMTHSLVSYLLLMVPAFVLAVIGHYLIEQPVYKWYLKVSKKT